MLNPPLPNINFDLNSFCQNLPHAENFCPSAETIDIALQTLDQNIVPVTLGVSMAGGLMGKGNWRDRSISVFRASLLLNLSRNIIPRLIENPSKYAAWFSGAALLGVECYFRYVQHKQRNQEKGAQKPATPVAKNTDAGSSIPLPLPKVASQKAVVTPPPATSSSTPTVPSTQAPVVPTKTAATSSIPLSLPKATGKKAAEMTPPATSSSTPTVPSTQAPVVPTKTAATSSIPPSLPKATGKKAAATSSTPASQSQSSSSSSPRVEPELGIDDPNFFRRLATAHLTPANPASQKPRTPRKEKYKNLQRPVRAGKHESHGTIKVPEAPAIAPEVPVTVPVPLTRRNSESDLSKTSTQSKAPENKFGSLTRRQREDLIAFNKQFSAHEEIVDEKKQGSGDAGFAHGDHQESHENRKKTTPSAPPSPIKTFHSTSPFTSPRILKNLEKRLFDSSTQSEDSSLGAAGETPSELWERKLKKSNSTNDLQKIPSTSRSQKFEEISEDSSLGAAGETPSELWERKLKKSNSTNDLQKIPSTSRSQKPEEISEDSSIGAAGETPSELWERKLKKSNSTNDLQKIPSTSRSAEESEDSSLDTAGETPSEIFEKKMKKESQKRPSTPPISPRLLRKDKVEANDDSSMSAIGETDSELLARNQAKNIMSNGSSNASNSPRSAEDRKNEVPTEPELPVLADATGNPEAKFLQLANGIRLVELPSPIPLSPPTASTLQRMATYGSPTRDNRGMKIGSYHLHDTSELSERMPGDSAPSTPQGNKEPSLASDLFDAYDRMPGDTSSENLVKMTPPHAPVVANRPKGALEKLGDMIGNTISKEFEVDLSIAQETITRAQTNGILSVFTNPSKNKE